LLREYSFALFQSYIVNIRIETQSGDWSDEEDQAGASGIPQDLSAAISRIKILENNLAKVKRDLSDYRDFVSERLDLARLTDALTSSPPSAPTPRDDDSHYFDSYGGNGILPPPIPIQSTNSDFQSFRYTRNHDPG
jgi:type I protein arginine methyltransferase